MLPLNTVCCCVLLQTPASQIELLIGLFGNLTDKQVEQMAKLLVSGCCSELSTVPAWQLLRKGLVPA